MSESKSLKTEVRLRPVYNTDMKDLWIWRNDAETRANSLLHDYVPWCQHARWFWQVYGSYDQKLMIAESYGVPIGTVRFDNYGDHVELSWTVAPEFRRQGLGLAIVEAACRHDPKQLLVAKILPHNVASLKIVEYLGFKEESRSPTAIVLTRRPK